MVPLTPPSVLFHENVTGSLLGETEPVPVPIVVQALSATAAHSSTGAAVNRLEFFMIQFLSLWKRDAPSWAAAIPARFRIPSPPVSVVTVAQSCRYRRAVQWRCPSPKFSERVDHSDAQAGRIGAARRIREQRGRGDGRVAEGLERIRLVGDPGRDRIELRGLGEAVAVAHRHLPRLSAHRRARSSAVPPGTSRPRTSW